MISENFDERKALSVQEQIELISDVNEKGELELKLTPDQRRAVFERGKILVSAAAGSGKTSTMIKRILLMIATGVRLKDMLVLVYNDAAQEDIKKRLHQKLFECACRTNGTLRAMFLRELDELSFAHISTFHSFCQSLIRENFEELGISATFEVLDQKANDALLASVLDAVMDEYAKSEGSAFDELFNAFASRSEDDFKQNILKIFRLMDIQPDRETFFKIVDECYGDFKGSKFFEILHSYYKNLFSTAKKYFYGMTAEIESVKLEKFSAANNYYYMLTTRLCAAKDFDELLSIANGFERPDIGKRQKSKMSAEDVEITDRFMGYANDLIESVKELKGFGDSLRFEAFHKQNALYVRELVKLTARFDDRLTLEKQKKNVLSFEDLMHHALRLLKLQPSLGEKFDACFVDEYQDINPTQEAIVCSLVKDECFMVGDVKQSIYGFRLASPAIFLSRRKSYELNGVNIDFNKNFRSQKRILQFVNGVFDAIMTKEIADVDYKDDGHFDVTDSADGEFVELHLFLNEKPPTKPIEKPYDIQNDVPEEEDSAATREGKFIASEIKRLVGNLVVGNRKASYGDIALLFRQRSKSVGKILSVLMSEGIPVSDVLDEGGGDDSVSDVLNFLKVIDNPRQDIPLAGFLLSFFGGYDEQELYEISTRAGECLYDKVLSRSSEDDALGRKLKNTLAQIDKYRVKASFKSVSELINGIISDFMYDAYLLARGEQRLNAARGLAAGVKDVSLGRFLEELVLKKDVGGRSYGGDRVQVSTFHGFKGLEIPVVFVCDMDVRFNLQSFKGDFLTANSGEMGIKYFDATNRTKYPTLSISVVRKLMLSEQIKDEMRLLYVALTRAKQKMYLTAKVDDFSSFGKKYSVVGASSDLDFLSRAKRDGGLNILPVLHDMGESAAPPATVSWRENDEYKKEIQRLMQFKYPYETSTKLSMKFSVTALDSTEDNLEAVSAFEEEAKTGTAYHAVMQNIDLFATTREGVEEEFRRLADGIMTPDELARVDKDDILRCLNSDLLSVAREAEKAGKCFRERRFMMYETARDVGVGEQFDTDDKVLVQGVIDMFIDGDKKIIIDFKNSSLKNEEVVKKYKRQLYLYKMAVEGATSAKVDELWLYSFKTGAALRCD